MFNIVKNVHYCVYSELRERIFGEDAKLTGRNWLQRADLEKCYHEMRASYHELLRKREQLRANHQPGSGMNSVHVQLELDKLYLEVQSREGGLAELGRALERKTAKHPDWKRITVAQLLRYGVDQDSWMQTESDVKRGIQVRMEDLNEPPIQYSA